MTNTSKSIIAGGAVIIFGIFFKLLFYPFDTEIATNGKEESYRFETLETFTPMKDSWKNSGSIIRDKVDGNCFLLIKNSGTKGGDTITLIPCPERLISENNEQKAEP